MDPPSCKPPTSLEGRRFSLDDTHIGDLAFQSDLGFTHSSQALAYNYAGGGLVVADFNNDGWDDIYLATINTDEFYLGSSDGFIAAHDWIPNNIPALSTGGAAADYDGDGDFDLLVAHAKAPDRLLRNDGKRFTDVSLTAGITEYDYDTSGVTWGDIDLDDDLDLILFSHREASFDSDDIEDTDTIVFPSPHPPVLFLNNADGTFSEQPLAFDLDPYPYSFSAVLLPQYGNPPLLYLINDFGPEWQPNLVFEWDGNRYTQTDSLNTLHWSAYGMGADVTDFNNDQEPDILISNWCSPAMLLSDSHNTWYNAEQAYGFVKCDDRHLFSWSPAAEDFDNDGDLDVWLSFGPFPTLNTDDINFSIDQPDAFFINNDQDLIYVSEIWDIEDTASARGGVIVDLNRDGQLDIIRAAINAPTEVYWGQCSEGNWLEVELDQEGLNRFGIGSKITIVTDEKTYTDWIFAGGEATGSGKPPRAHFGLGAYTITDIIVTWPDGETNSYTTDQLNARITITR